MADLATVDDLASFVQSTLDPADPSPALYLSIASGMVRDYLQQEITQVVDDIVYCDPVGGSFVALDELPVGSVSLVETTADGGATWTTADPTTYTVSRRTGLIFAKPYTGVCWPGDPESWRVTYTHGYATVPDTIKGICLSVAARGFSIPVGVDSERVGQRQVKYDLGELTDVQELALSRYRVARVA